MLKSELKKNVYLSIPSNFGIKNEILNTLIGQFNELVREKLRLTSLGNGENSPLVKNIVKQLDELYANILSSIDSYEKSISSNLNEMMKKESEFENFYISIPEKEKFLKQIERQLFVKESLYTLLLQKREEASINLAVVRPSIKLID